MMYEEILNTFIELKKILLEKKDTIIKKDLDKLAQEDESCIVLCEKIKKYNIAEQSENLTIEQKNELKKIGNEIKNITDNNEILIKHSISVINNLLSGIFDISLSENSTYNQKGKGYNDEVMDISLVMEEA